MVILQHTELYPVLVVNFIKTELYRPITSKNGGNSRSNVLSWIGCITVEFSFFSPILYFLFVSQFVVKHFILST